MYAKRLFDKLTSSFAYIYPVTIAVALFLPLHLVVDKNRHFLIVYTLLFLVLYTLTKKLFNAAWLLYLAIFPFNAGRYFNYEVISTSLWGGDRGLGFDVPILFSDVLLVFMVYFLVTRRRKKKIYKLTRSRQTFVFLFLFLIIAGISVFSSNFGNTSTFFFLQLTRLILLFFVAKAAFTDKNLLKKSLQLLLLFVFANSVLIIFQFINGAPLGLKIEDLSDPYGWYADENPGLYRPGGMYADPNIAATIISSFYPIIFLGTLFKEKLKNAASWLILSLVSVALILTGSRSSWIVVIALSVFGFLYFKKRINLQTPDFVKRYKWPILLLFLILLGPLFFMRLFTLFETFSGSGGAIYRLDQIRISLSYLSSNLFGVGIGAFPYTMILDYPFIEYGYVPVYPHNIFAQISAETGVLGLITFGLFLYYLLREKYFVFKKKGLFAGSIFLATLTALLLSNLFPWVFHSKLAPFFWILLAI